MYLLFWTAKQIKSLSIDDVEYLGLAAQRPGGSPTSDLLTKWGQSNPTVMDLFYHLKATKNERALAVLKGVGMYHNAGNTSVGYIICR